MTILPKIFCLLGPTAAGKTDLALEFAAQFPCDIISVDSAQIYRGMDIGTAKPSAAVLRQVPHRLIDILEPEQAYSAADFCTDVVREITQSLSQQRIPLLVGGTMMYFRALQTGLSVLPVTDPLLRQALTAELQANGLKALYDELTQVDPSSAARIKPNDTQRIQRALEVYRSTGTPMSQLQQQKPPRLPYQFINVAIMPDDRKLLHQRIAIRFAHMLAEGFVTEVATLKQRVGLNLALPSMRAVGYRQIWHYLEGQSTKAAMAEQAIAATRQLAKRQLTWLRSWPDLVSLADFKRSLAEYSFQ